MIMEWKDKRKIGSNPTTIQIFMLAMVNSVDDISPTVSTVMSFCGANG